MARNAAALGAAERIMLSGDGLVPALEVLHQKAGGGAPRPPILFIHGYTAGAWQFAAHVMPALAHEGWTSYAVNLRGHGGSQGQETVRKARFADYAEDVRRAARFVEETEGYAPILVGHSLGSVLARDYASRNAVTGLALASFGDIAIGMKGFMTWMMRHFPFQGMAGMITGRPSKMFSRFEPQYAVMYQGHPREAVRGNIERLMAQPDSDKVFMELRKIRIGPAKGDIPILVIAGGADPIASPASVRSLAASLGTEPIILDHKPHDLFAGPDWRDTFTHLTKWLASLAP